MKNQYFADVGDFGKYGFLGYFSRSNLNLGINWYLTNDDTKNDGKFTEYFNKPDFISCDIELHNFLNHCIKMDKRNVNELSNYHDFEKVAMYDECLELSHINALSPKGREHRRTIREDWFDSSISFLDECDIIFCDPDNGIETKSLSRIGKDSVKYVFITEIQRMLENGKSIICYNHRDRSKESDYFARFLDIKSKFEDDIDLRIFRFGRYSVRDYLVFVQPQHKEEINLCLKLFLEDRNWMKLFSELDIDCGVFT